MTDNADWLTKFVLLDWFINNTLDWLITFLV